LPFSIRTCSPAGSWVGEYQANVSQISSEFQDCQLVTVFHSTSQDRSQL
jgi:hypothetical protein